MTYDFHNALWRLRRQHSAGIHTCNPCPHCQQRAIGADLCAYCIAEEMVKHGAPRSDINLLRNVLAARESLDRRIDDITSKIIDHVEE